MTTSNLILPSFLPSFLTGVLNRSVITNTRAVNTGSVNDPSAEWWDMFDHWELPIHLMEGTVAMRAAKRTFLPQEEREEDSAYTNRLTRTVLYGAYSRTLKSLAGLPFKRNPIVEGLSEDLEYLLDVADNQGRNLTNFCHNVLLDVLNFGKGHILVDFPVSPGDITLAQERDLGMNPYFVQISPLNLIGWETDFIGGSEVLTQIRIFEEYTTQDPDNEFRKINVQRVRVIEPDRVRIFEQREDTTSQFELVETLPNTLGFIPLVTIYGNRIGTMQAYPVLEELAWLNLRHYQKLSDVDNIEHVANTPILFGAGFGEDEIADIEIGPHRAIFSSNADAKMRYVEHTGVAIRASQESLRELEKRMITMGADLLVKSSGGRVTATAKMLDDAKSVSILEAGVLNLEEGIKQAFEYAALWKNQELEDFKINIGDNLDVPLSANDFTSLIQLANESKITQEELISELKRRGILSDSFRSEALPEPEPAPNPFEEQKESEEEDNEDQDDEEGSTGSADEEEEEDNQ